MKLVHLFIPLLLFGACSADETTVITNELVIGLSYGECTGDCAFLYLLKDDMVYTDSGVDRVSFDPANHTFSSTPLPNIDQLLYDSLFSQLPGNLGEYEREDFGCPDCGDGGSLHVIRSTEEGVYNIYQLDNMTEEMDAGLRPYGRLMKRALVAFRR
ncbi:MAG: hypothetical protein AB8F78_10950 [Saprospiraceae bacterium]